jgi:hypothetical protein
MNKDEEILVRLICAALTGLLAADPERHMSDDRLAEDSIDAANQTYRELIDRIRNKRI